MTTSTPSSHELNSAIAAGITTALNSLAPDLPALAWSMLPTGRLSGQATADHSQDEVPGMLAAWADRFGLQKVPASVGATEYGGELHSWQVRVWGVTDRDPFERSNEAPTRYRWYGSNS